VVARKVLKGKIMGEHGHGRYTGKLLLAPLQGGQVMKTVQEFGFVDTNGKHWPVPPGTTLAGASIPQALWPLLGGRWQAEGREACAVHDYHSAVRSADWRSVHRMFHDALVASGVSEGRATLAYAGIYFVGPRWESILAVSQPDVSTQTSAGDILYALCRDPIRLAVSEAVECEGTSAFDWVAASHHPTDRVSAVTLRLDKLAGMIEEDAPSLEEVEAAIDYAWGLIPFAKGRSRAISALAMPAKP